MPDPVVLQLIVEDAQYRSRIKQTTTEVETNLNRQSIAAARSAAAMDVAFRRAGDSTGALRMASIGAGQQLQDMTVQLQGGTAATTVFAQQVPQLAFALIGLEGSTNKAVAGVGKFAAFLSGPWGVAINIAVIALGAIIGGMDDAGNAADKNKKKVDGLTASLERLTSIQGQANAADLGAVGVLVRQQQGRVATIDSEIARLRSAGASQFNSIYSPAQSSGSVNAARIARLKKERDQLVSQIADNEMTIRVTQLRMQKETERKALGQLDKPSATGTTSRTSSSTSAASDLDRQRAAYSDFITALQQTIVLDQMRADGLSREADLLEAQWDIKKRFPDIDQQALQQATDLTKALIDQKAATEDIADLRSSIMRDTKSAGSLLTDEQRAEIAKQWRELTGFDGKQIDDSLQYIADNGVRALSDGIGDAIVNARSLGDVFRNVSNQIISDIIRIGIQQAISGENGGGIFGSIVKGVGSIFGGKRAAGGPVSSGQTYLVGERGPELFQPGVSGNIVPNHLIAAQASRAASQPGSAVVRVELSNDLRATVTQISGEVAVQVNQAMAPGIVNASVAETFRQGGRPRL